jgi:pimeloyl-ACP methyl ester carboxylesterase
MTHSDSVPPHFIVFVPGYMGSKLREKTTGKVLWLDLFDFPRILLTPNGLDNWINALRLPGDNLEAFEMLDHILYAPPFIKMEGYGPIVPALEGMGYKADPKRYAEAERDVHIFAYDWRQDNRASGRLLGAAVDRWSGMHPGKKPVVIAHSNGGVVARWYIEKEGGKDRVLRLFLMGSPRDGTPTAMQIVYTGFDALMRQGFNLFDLPRRSRELFRTFPSIYQITPITDNFLRDSNGQPLDFVAGRASWLDDAHEQELAADAGRFHTDLGNQLSVETICIFGRKRFTYSGGIVHLDANSRWSAIDWQVDDKGDGTIPERSATYAAAKKMLPFNVDHGHLFYDPAVLAQLEYELIGRFQGEPERSVVTTANHIVSFEPTRDFYKPGEPLTMRASVHTIADATPVGDAQITVRMNWLDELPGQPKVDGKPRTSTGTLEPAKTPGEYEGSLTAPDLEGYYRLNALVVIPGTPSPVALEELVAVEGTQAGVAASSTVSQSAR